MELSWRVLIELLAKYTRFSLPLNEKLNYIYPKFFIRSIIIGSDIYVKIMDVKKVIHGWMVGHFILELLNYFLLYSDYNKHNCLSVLTNRLDFY